MNVNPPGIKTYISLLLMLPVMLCWRFASPEKNTQWHRIPAQTICLSDLLTGMERQMKTQAYPEFEISSFITFKAYKVYLAAVLNDSGETYYRSQLPDTTIALPGVYKKYITGTAYDDDPVMGISWDNAMNYCRWKTKQDNRDTIRFIYRLPACSEWLAAKHSLEQQQVKTDLSKNYSDWLMSSKDESVYDFLGISEKTNSFVYDDAYFHKPKDGLVLKRKLAIGDSYFFQQELLVRYLDQGYYATTGYRHIGFRMVKEYVGQPGSAVSYRPKLAENVLQYWNLEKW